MRMRCNECSLGYYLRRRLLWRYASACVCARLHAALVSTAKVTRCIQCFIIVLKLATCHFFEHLSSRIYADILQITENVDASVLGIGRRFTELCLYEMIANDTQTIEEALAAYNESLFSGSDDEGPSSLAEMMYSEAVRQLIQSTGSQVCPGQPACTGRGTCSNSTCTCDAGKPTFISLLRSKKTITFVSGAGPALGMLN